MKAYQLSKEDVIRKEKNEEKDATQPSQGLSVHKGYIKTPKASEKWKK